MEKNIDSTLIIAKKHTDKRVQSPIQLEKAPIKSNEAIGPKANLASTKMHDIFEEARLEALNPTKDFSDQNANLTQANLWGTQLPETDLNGAFLNRAELRGAEKTPSTPKTMSKIIPISIVLGVVALTAILQKFDGLIEIKLGLEGGHVLIDGRKPPLSPLITDNLSNND